MYTLIDYSNILFFLLYSPTGIFPSVKLPKLKLKRKYFNFGLNKGSYNITSHKDANTSLAIPSISSHVIEDNSCNIMLANHTSTSNHILSGGDDNNNVDDNDDARVGVSIVNPGNENAMQKNRQYLNIQFNDIRKSGILLNIPTKSNNAKRTTYTTPMSRDMNHEKFTPCTGNSMQHQQHEKSINLHSTSSTIAVDINANSLQQKNGERKSIRNDSHAAIDTTGDVSRKNGTIVKIKPPPRHKRKSKLVISANGQVEMHGKTYAEPNKLLASVEMATSKITTAMAPIVPIRNKQTYMPLDKSVSIATPCQPPDVPSTSNVYNKLDPWTVKSTADITVTQENCERSSNNYCSSQQMAQHKMVLHSFEDHFVADNWPNRNECINELTEKNVHENDAQQNAINMLKKGNSHDIFKSFDSENMQQQFMGNVEIDDNIQFDGGVHHRHDQLANTIFSENQNKNKYLISSKHIPNNMHMIDLNACKSDSRMYATNGNPVNNEENFVKQEDTMLVQQQHNYQQLHYQLRRRQNFQNNFTRFDKKPYKYNDECEWKNENPNFPLNHDMKSTLPLPVAEIKVEVVTTTTATTTTTPETPSNCNGIVFMDDRKSCFDDSLIKPKVNNDDSFLAKHARGIFRTNNFGCRNDDMNERKNLHAQCESGGSSGFSDNTIRTSGIRTEILVGNGKMVSENEHFNGKLCNTRMLLYICIYVLKICLCIL